MLLLLLGLSPPPRPPRPAAPVPLSPPIFSITCRREPTSFHSPTRPRALAVRPPVSPHLYVFSVFVRQPRQVVRSLLKCSDARGPSSLHEGLSRGAHVLLVRVARVHHGKAGRDLGGGMQRRDRDMGRAGEGAGKQSVEADAQLRQVGALPRRAHAHWAACPHPRSPSPQNATQASCTSSRPPCAPARAWLTIRDAAYPLMKSHSASERKPDRTKTVGRSDTVVISTSCGGKGVTGKGVGGGRHLR